MKSPIPHKPYPLNSIHEFMQLPSI